jgi:hypothetical protein
MLAEEREEEERLRENGPATPAKHERPKNLRFSASPGNGNGDGCDGDDGVMMDEDVYYDEHDEMHHMHQQRYSVAKNSCYICVRSTDSHALIP